MKKALVSLILLCVGAWALAAWAQHSNEFESGMTAIQESARTAGWLSVLLQVLTAGGMIGAAVAIGGARQELKESRADITEMKKENTTQFNQLFSRVNGLGREVSELKGEVRRHNRVKFDGD